MAIIVSLYPGTYAQRAVTAGEQILVVIYVVVMAAIFLVIVITDAERAEVRHNRPQVQRAADRPVMGIVLAQFVADHRFFFVGPQRTETAGQRGAHSVDQRPGSVCGYHALRANLHRIDDRYA
ncbi:hypothetical protein D3C77_592180 [compost metagenome]